MFYGHNMRIYQHTKSANSTMALLNIYSFFILSI